MTHKKNLQKTVAKTEGKNKEQCDFNLWMLELYIAEIIITQK